MNQLQLSFFNATGVIEYNMTNNYMFRYILQENQKVLKGLICSLLHLDPKSVREVIIKNPINLSGDVSGKEFILDIHVMLNDERLINLEMQNCNEYNWPERSLSYLCRSYDQLYRGQKYEEALPVIHIGFLDFTLYPEDPEFYATYQMLNVKNHRLYSDKFTLSVVNLSQISLATDEDKAYQIDYWASLFKAGTWEELQMLTKDNEYLQEAAESLYIANSDEIIRQQCIAREDAERRERTLERNYKLAQEALAEKNSLIAQQEATMQQQEAAMQQQAAAMQRQKTALQQQRLTLDAQAEEIARLKALLLEK